jgi:hypothetical protein
MQSVRIRVWDMSSAVFTIFVLRGTGADKLFGETHTHTHTPVYMYPTLGPWQYQAVSSTYLCGLHTKCAEWVHSAVVVFSGVAYKYVIVGTDRVSSEFCGVHLY